MRMGIGIGWPNASASNQSQMVYFRIAGICGDGPVLPGKTTQLVNSSIYKTGDYVEYTNDEITGRVWLGTPVPMPGVIYNISGPVYNSCPT
jgi:hypothetical protein